MTIDVKNILKICIFTTYDKDAMGAENTTHICFICTQC